MLVLLTWSIALMATPTNTVIKRPLDLIVPKGPEAAFAPDYQTSIGLGTSDKVFVFTSENPGVLSLNTTDIGNRDFSISKLPDRVAVGPRSLFYMKRGTSTDFVFTDSSRKNVFYGTNASGYPLINRIGCGPFSEISDIHLAESAANTTANLVVADRGADTVYSYVLTPGSSTTLCSAEVSTSITNPLWLQSVTSVPPVLYVGYRDSTGLRVRAFQSTDFAPITAEKTITTSTRAQYGRPFLDTVSTELFFPVKLADDSVGQDYIVKYDSALTTRTNLSTCRSPEQIQMDFEGASRYLYVFCPVAREIRYYNTSLSYLGSLSAGTSPKKMWVGSDGLSRFVSILQTRTSIQLHKTTIAAPVATTSTSLSLSSIATDFVQMIGTGAITDRAILVSPASHLAMNVNLGTQALSDTLRLPKSITSLAAQSSTAAHFVSASTNTAYSLTEVNSNVWRMRLFDVGTYPLQIGYRANRLYTLNRDGNSVSVINLATRAVSSMFAGTRPVSMDFETTTDHLWTVAETSKSIWMFDIPVGTEVVNATTPTVSFGFTPKKIKYQSSDETLYIVGETTALALDAADLTTLSTQTLAAAASDLVTTTGGATISSIAGTRIYSMDRTTLTGSLLSSPPHLLTSNSATAVAGLGAETTFVTTSGFSKTNPFPFNRLFSNSTNLFAYQNQDLSLSIMPYSLFTSTTFPSVGIKIEVDPQVTADDGSGNMWMADSSRLRIQRLSASFQKDVLANSVLNHPEDIAVWDAQDKIYIALRNLNALAIVNAVTSSVSYYSVCQGPHQIKIDTAQPKLFVLCPESDSLSAITLTAAGAFSSQTIVAAEQLPKAMALNTTSNRLYVANEKSDSVTIYNSLTNALLSTTSVHERPIDLALNTTNGTVSIIHRASVYLSQLSSLGVLTNVDTGSRGFSKIDVDSTTGRVFAVDPSAPTSFTFPTMTLTTSGTILTGGGRPEGVTVSASNAKAYLLYTDKNAVSIINEASSVQKDVSVGSSPKYAKVVSSASKVFVSNFDDNSLSVISTTTDAVTATISLTSGCGPTRMESINVGGTVYLYILCQQSDSLELVNTTTNTVGTPLSLRITN